MYRVPSGMPRQRPSPGREGVRLIRHGSDFPLAISIELTSKCNLKCKMCPLTVGTSSSSKSVSFMDLAVWRALLEQIDGRVGKVILTGFGEPMLHPHLLEMLADLDARGIPFGMTTNGVQIAPGIEDLLPTLTSMRHLNVSIDSFAPDIYREIRRGKVSKCLASIERLARACGPRTVFSVSAVIMHTTLPSLMDAPRQLAARGVRHLVLQSLFDQNPCGLDEHIADPARATEDIAAIRRAGEEHGVAVTFESTERLTLELDDPPEARRRYFDDSRKHGTGRLCGLPWDMLHVDANSEIFPCCRAAAVDDCAKGRLAERSLSDIWQGSGYEDFRRSFASPETLPEVCATCTAVPAGIPLRAECAGDVMDGVEIRENGTLRVSVRNTGAAAWMAARAPTVGVSRPRDRVSPLRDERWISANRVCAMREERVEPGGIAHFDMPVGASGQAVPAEHFELVIDGKMWVPGTGFSLDWT